MPRRFVVQPNGRFACFSTIVDDFIIDDMTLDAARRFGLREFGAEMTERKIKAAIDELERFDDCIDDIVLQHGVDVARQRRKELSEVIEDE